ncbi:MAG: TetR/AcrR family transcriptional regulator [Cyclobacteriaceae bacterium]
MTDYFTQIKIRIDESMFIKDPDSSEIGKNIISGSISLIDKIGFEAFTIKKLGLEIGSPESTIYRYFENKQKILIYLINWYWCWLEYRLIFDTANIPSPEEKLKTAISLLTEPVREDSDFLHVNEVTLYRIVTQQSSKVYNTQEVDNDNKKGLFEVYKRIVLRVGEMVLAVNPKFQYPGMLISSVIEAANKQHFFSEYLPAITEAEMGDSKIPDFFVRMVLNTINERE